MWTYRTVRAVLTAASHVFFREIHLVGREHIPGEGEASVVFAGNHPNSLIDPVLVVTTSGRIVHFAAKDKLFTPPLGALLAALGAVPVMRAMDHGSGPRDNSGALDALQAVLMRGRAMGIFPEGLSHDRAHLQKLRTGAARVALRSGAGSDDLPVVIVPVGLTYKHRKRFRSRVLVQYGEPIAVGADRVAAWREDSRAAATALTGEIEQAIRQLTVNAPDWETLRVIDAVRRMYQPSHISLEDRVELARRFCEGYAAVRDEPDVVALFRDVHAWLDDLDDAGLEDRDLVRGLNPVELWWRGLSNVLRIGLWLPLAVPGAPVHAPLVGVIHWAGLTFAARPDAIGTTRLAAGVVLVGALYLGLPVLAWLLWGLGPALAVAVLLPLTGLATVKTLERGASLRRILKSGWAALSLGGRMEELAARRVRLLAEVEAVVDRHIPEDMERLFPR